MTLDAELLRRYAQAKSEDVFAELVRRHVDIVYSAAFWHVNGVAHLAQDTLLSRGTTPGRFPSVDITRERLFIRSQLGSW